MPAQKASRLHLLNEFESAPHSALFNQQSIAAVLSCSTQLLERNRWSGGGFPYLKIGRKVLYRKSDVLNFLQQLVFVLIDRILLILKRFPVSGLRFGFGTASFGAGLSNSA